MIIKKADVCDFLAVKSITADTINAIYPHYYPHGAVEFFLMHHSDENILADIKSGIVYLIFCESTPVGTVTIKENEICRLFVTPSFQGKGYGKALLSFSENEIKKSYDKITLSASLPAKAIYIKRGYKEVSFNTIKTENLDFLCYDQMEKDI